MLINKQTVGHIKTALHVYVLAPPTTCSRTSSEHTVKPPAVREGWGYSLGGQAHDGLKQIYHPCFQRSAIISRTHPLIPNVRNKLYTKKDGVAVNTEGTLITVEYAAPPGGASMRMCVPYLNRGPCDRANIVLIQRDIPMWRLHHTRHYPSSACMPYIV